jgi:hypothetical protein
MSQDLRRTPTSAGNQKVFTYSCWIKRNKVSDWMRLLSIMNGNTDAIIQLTNVDKLRFRDEVTGPDIDYISSRPLRDVGSWMHVLVAIDTTATQAEHRIRMYINGDSLIEHGLDTESMPGDKNLNLQFNDSGLEHRFFARNNDSEYFLGEAFDLFWVDGQALTPDVFGFNKDGDGYISVGSTQATDFRPGQWVPKSPRTIKSEINRRGGFGVNGFYLPMNDSSNFGADFHMTPDTIIKLKGEDLPQPRNGLPTTSDNYVSQLRSDPYAANLVLAVPGVNTQPTGSELVTNGTFDTNVSGWTVTDTGTIVRQSDGTAKVTRGSSAEVVYQNITTVVGTTYELSVDITDIAGSHGQVYVRSTYNSGSLDAKIGYSFYTGTFKGTFTADTTTTRIILYAHPSGSTSYDNISVKATTIRDYSADIKGSGTNKTFTPAGDAGVRSPHGDNGFQVHGYYGSALQFDGSGDYFSIPHSSDFNFSTGDFTAECWINPTSLPSGDKCILEFRGSGGGSDGWVWFINSSNVMQIYDGGTLYTAASGTIIANQLNHIAISRKSGIFTYYLNGAAVGTLTTYTTSTNASSTGIRIGIRQDTTNGYHGFIQDLRIYKGVAKYTGGFDVPKPYSPTRSLETWRQVPDTCKNNFCTMDPLQSNTVKRNTGAYVASILNFTEGNLSVRNSGNAGLSPQMAGFSSFGMDSGKWYWELSNWENPANERYGISLGREQVFTQTGTGAAIECMLQVRGSNGEISSGGNYNGSAYEYLVSGTIDNTNATGLTSSSDVVGLAFDRDNMAFYVYTNGTLTASITNITVSKTKVSTWFATKGNNSSSTSSGQTYNFGQNPTFGGTLTAGTYTDSNGKGLFKYQPPTGYLALCEDNLPAPAIADPGEHFKCVLYEGDNASSHAISGVGFQPDLVWLKQRTGTTSHNLTDSVRGIGKTLFSDDVSADNTNTNRLQSFDSNGFTVGGNGAVNQSGSPFVAWCWKAGGAAVANTDGSINSQVSVNQTAGFSIVSYTGTGNVGNVGHGLGKRPKVVIVKRRDASTNWPIFFDGISDNTNDLLQLNLTNATATDGNFFNGGNTTTTTFPLGTGDGQTNASGSGHIAYCWAEIPGYSKFSFYQGTGQADGPFVYCGFKPAWVMVKCSSNGSTNWRIWDSSRGSTNPTNLDLLANASNIENQYSSDEIDLLSNGFKIRSTGSWHNLAGGSFIFMAFAESPFQTANAK